MSVATTPCTPNLGASADGPAWSLPRLIGRPDGQRTGPCAFDADVGTPSSATASMSVEGDASASPLPWSSVIVDDSASRHAPSPAFLLSPAAATQVDMAASDGGTYPVRSAAEGSGRCSSDEDAHSAANSLSFCGTELYDR
jgi:hypothetical protein